MAYLALYRKYRPVSFDEMVGQDHIITIIRNAVINNKVSHAYLFSGPRGTGKTTTAKIIAKMVNCEKLKDGIPCGKCNSCRNILNSNDVIEIDAASNNGVDEIRELRDKINLVPSELKYKIYIIDEVHMLTTQAFNALLKTLEEPPKHVIFILATTEIHKIPMTIISRCQKFQFSKIDIDSMVKNLKRIVDSEKLHVSDDILIEISRLSDGCCRDAVNLLDQLLSYGSDNFTLEQLYDISGSVSYLKLYELLELIVRKDSLKIMEFCNDINIQGKSIFKFIEEFMLFLKDIISYKVGVDDVKIIEKRNKIVDISNNVSLSMLYELIDMLNDLLGKIKVSTYPSILLSVSLLHFVDSIEKINEIKNKSDKFIDFEENSKTFSIDKDANLISGDGEVDKHNISLSDKDIEIRINNTLATASKSFLNEIKDSWTKIYDYSFDSNYSSIVGILRDCIAVAAGEMYVIICPKYESLVERVNSKYYEIEDLFFKVFNKKINVVAINDDTWNIEKTKYINNLKLGIKYKVKSMNVFDSTISSNNNLKKDDQTDLEVLKDLIGNDIIECVK